MTVSLKNSVVPGFPTVEPQKQDLSDPKIQISRNCKNLLGCDQRKI